MLVQPKVNGREVGYMILDTGASGFVMEKAAADELGLESFGQLHVSGMAGKVRTCRQHRLTPRGLHPVSFGMYRHVRPPAAWFFHVVLWICLIGPEALFYPRNRRPSVVQVHSQFRRADSVQIGPLLMKRPLFMEMMLGGIVRGAPGPVVGIVGYDIFRRSVIELPVQKAVRDFAAG